MKTKITLNFRSFTRVVAATALMVFASVAYGQAPFKGGQTYWVDGAGVDLVSPKDTFANFNGAHILDDPYTATTGIITALNNQGVDPTTVGAISFVLSPGYTGSEAGTINIGRTTTGGYPFMSSQRHITIKPSAGNSFTITSSTVIGANSSLVRFNAAQFVTIEGSSSLGTRNLTFAIPAGSTTASIRVIDIIPYTNTGCQGIIIQNCRVVGNSAAGNVGGAINTFAGIYYGGSTSTPSSPLRPAQNISVINNVVDACQNPIYIRGKEDQAGKQDLNLIVRNNILGGTIQPVTSETLPTTYIGGAVNAAGITVIAQKNAIIENNIIRNNNPAFGGFRGISIINSAATLALDSNVKINANKIYNLRSNAAGTGVYGIRINLGTHTQSLAISLTNNTIGKLIASNGGTTVGSLTYTTGIMVEDASANAGISIYHNSVHLYGDTLNAGAFSACLVTGTSTTGGLSVANNIFANRMGRSMFATGNTPFSLIYAINAATAIPFASNANNALYVNNTAGSFAFVGYVAGKYRPSIDNWKLAVAAATGSTTLWPSFVNNDDSTLTIGNGAVTTMGNMGAALNVLTDINGNPRSTTTPSVGAFEFSGNAANANSALLGGKTYPINGVSAWPAGVGANGSFATLADAVTYLNTYGVNGFGTVVLEFASGYTGETTFIPSILEYLGNDVTIPLLIRVSAGNSYTVSAPSNTIINNQYSLLSIIGAKYITIDGQSTVGQRNLTFRLPSSMVSTSIKVISLSPTDSTSISNITIRNCNIMGALALNGVNTAAGIYHGHYNPAAIFQSTQVGLNNNFTITNNYIGGVRTGIYLRGANIIAGQNRNYMINRNVIGGTEGRGSGLPFSTIGGSADQAGIYLKAIANSTVDSNVIRNTDDTLATSNGFRGIDMEGAGELNATDSNLVISRNTIYNLSTTTGTYCTGIRLNLGVTNGSGSRRIRIVNNAIAKIRGFGASASASATNPSGILIDGTAADIGLEIFQNTVQLNGTSLSPLAGHWSYCIFLGSGITGAVKLQNNLLMNRLGRTAVAAGNNYAVYTATAASSTVGPFTLASGGFINSNSYGADGVNTTNNFVIGTSAANYLYIKQWQAAINQDFTSYSFNSFFSNDSMPTPDPVFAGPLFNGSLKIADVNNDIKGTTRSGIYTCVGALEFTLEYLPITGDQSYLINGVNNYPTPTGTAPFSFATISEAINYINSNGVDGISPDTKKAKLIITTGYVGEADTLIPALKAYPRMNGSRIIVLTNSAGRSDTIRTGINRPYSANGSVMRFNGGSNFEIDGSSDGATSTRNITITFPAITSTNLASNNLKLIDITPGEDVVSNVRIRNCNLIGNTTGSVNNTFAAIYVGGITSTPSAPLFSGNNNMLFENNFIGGVKYGLYAQGATAGLGQQDKGLVVKANVIGADAPGITNQWGGVANAAAIYLNAQVNASVDSNVISNNVTGFIANRAIELAATGTSSIDSNVSITRNTITKIRNTTASGAAYGIMVNLGADDQSNITIANNMISGIQAPGTASTPAFSLANPFGIYVDATAVVNDLNLRIWNNSINLGTATSLGTTNNAISSCIAFGANVRGGIALRNNILQNKLGRVSGTGSAYSIIAGHSANIFTVCDNNCYYAAAPGATNGIAVMSATTGTPVRYNTLPEFTALTGQDSMSLSFNTNFTNDTLLTLNGFQHVISAWGAPLAGVTTDLTGEARNLIQPTIGADELPFGGVLADSIAPRIFNVTQAPTTCGNGPFLITYRVFESSINVASDTLYYSINNGPELFVVGATSVTNRFTRTYTVPASAIPNNTSIGYRLAVRDKLTPTPFRTVYPASGYEYISSVYNTFPLTYGFDLPNYNGWYVESQGPGGVGTPAAGGWQLNTFGSGLNPVLTPQTGVKAALFPSATLPSNTLSRLVSPCLDLSGMKVPTVRIWVSQNGEALNNLDVVQVVVSAASSPNGRIWSSPLGSVVRPNANLSFPGFVQLDVCLQNFPFNGVVVGIEGISKNGMNIVLDSIVIFDDVQSQLISPLSTIICAYNELSINLPTSSSLYSYTMFDAFAGTPLGSSFVGNSTGGALTVKAPNPSNPAIGRVDSTYAIIRYTNIQSGCSYQLPDTSKQYIRNFYGGPFVVKGTPFTAVFAAGTKVNPDGAKVGDAMQYSFVPPSGFTNANYGTNWTILNTSVKTPLGNVPMSSAIFAAPSGGNATYTLSPALVDVDSTFILTATIRLLPSNCDSTITRYIKVTSAPATAFTNASDSVCLGASIYFTNTTTFLPNTAPITYLWEFGDGTIATTKDGNKTYAFDKAPGMYTVKLTAYNNAGVFASASKQIRVLGVPATSYTNGIACGTDSIQFTNNTTGAISYMWTSRLNGVTKATSTDVNPKFNFPISDTLYAVTLRATDALGCFRDSTNGVFSFAKPTAAFTVTNHCLGVRATFNNQTTISSGVNGRVNTFGSEWDFGNGQTGLSNSPVYTFPANGTFIVKLKTTSNYGCMDSSTKSVTVFDKPRAGFTAGIACQGAVVSLNNNTSYSGAPNKVVYNWNFGDFTPISTDFAPVKSYGVLGTYIIRLVAMDTVNNCTDTTTKTVEVNERPLALFASTKGCEDVPLPFTNGSIPPVGQTLTYTWNFGDGGTDVATNPIHTYASDNGGVKYVVTMVATTNKGCSDQKIDSVSIDPVPNVTFTKTELNETTWEFEPGTKGLNNYRWDFGDGTIVNDPSGNKISNQYQNRGWHKVTLTVQSANGCTGSRLDSVETKRSVGIEDLFAAKFNLSVYPNPFEDVANITYNLTSAQDVTVTVYDLVGRTVANVKHVNQSAGNHTVKLDESAFTASSAMYMVRIQIGDDVITKQLMRK
ncbi:MAG: PKD domain-containing protein [Bacteroidota bacterium]